MILLNPYLNLISIKNSEKSSNFTFFHMFEADSKKEALTLEY